jgi:hypothetical protein
MRRLLLAGLGSLILVSGCATLDSPSSQMDVSDLRGEADGGDMDSVRRLAEFLARGVVKDGDLVEAVARLRSLGGAARPADRGLLAVVLGASGQLQGAFDGWIKLVVDESAQSWIRRLAARKATALVDRVSLKGVAEILGTPVACRGLEVEVSDLLMAVGDRLGSAELRDAAIPLISAPRTLRRSGRVRPWGGTRDEDTTWDSVKPRRGAWVMPDEGPGSYEVLFDLDESDLPRTFEIRTSASVTVHWSDSELGRHDRWGAVAPSHSRWLVPAGPQGEVRVTFTSARGGFSPRLLLNPAPEQSHRDGGKSDSKSTLLERLAFLEQALQMGDVRGATDAARRLVLDRRGVAALPLVLRLDWDPTLADERTRPERIRMLVSSIEATVGLGSAQAELILRTLANGDVAHARALRASASLGEASSEIDLTLAREAEDRHEARRLSARLFNARPHSCQAAIDWIEIHWESLTGARDLERATWPDCVSVTRLRARLALESSRLEDAVALAKQAAGSAVPGVELVEATLLVLEALWKSGKSQEAMTWASHFVANRDPGVEQVLDWIVRHGAPGSVTSFEERLRSHRGISQEVRASALRASDIGLPLTKVEAQIDAALVGSYTPEEGADSVEVLFHERFIRPLADGTLIHRHHQLFLIRSEEAVEAWGEIPLPEGAEVLVARTWRRGRSGRLLALESEDWSSTGAISLPGLGEGTIAEVAIVWIEDPDTTVAPIWSTARLPLGFQDAHVRRARVVLVHDDRGPVQVESGGDVDVTRSPGRIEVEARDVAGRPVEPLDPRPELRLPWARFSGGSDGGLSVSRWHAAEALRASRALRLTPTVEGKARELTEGLSDERQRLRAIHNAVLSEIQDEASSLSAREASVVLGRGTGERSIALVALCRAAGHQCDLIAARPMVRGIERPLETLVDADDWVYPVVRARTKEGWVWLDTASAYAPFDFVPPMLAGVEGLVLEDDLSRVRLPQAEESQRGQRTFSVSIRVALDGTYVAQGEETLTGLYAMSWRHVLADMTPEQRHNALDRLVQASLPGAGVEDLRFQNLEDRNAPLIVHWRAEGAGLMSGEEARLSVALSPENLSRSTVHLAKRSSPLLVSRSTDLEVRLRIELPASWRLAQAPSTVDVDQGLIEYHRSAEIDGPNVQLYKRCRLSVGLVLPGVYSKWIEAARNVDRADRIELVFKRPAQ